MYDFMPPNGLFPASSANKTPTQYTADLQTTLQKLLADQLKSRMEEESDNNDTFDHVIRSGDDTGA